MAPRPKRMPSSSSRKKKEMSPAAKKILDDRGSVSSKRATKSLTQPYQSTPKRGISVTSKPSATNNTVVTTSKTPVTSIVDADKTPSNLLRRRLSYGSNLRRSMFTPARNLHTSPTSPKRTRIQTQLNITGATPRAPNTPFRLKAAHKLKEPKKAAASHREKRVYSPEQHEEWDLQVKGWQTTWGLSFMSAMTGFDVHVDNLRKNIQNSLKNKVSDHVPFNVKVSITPYHCFSRDPAKTDYVSLSISYSIPTEWRVDKRSKAAHSKKVLLYEARLVSAGLQMHQPIEGAGEAAHQQQIKPGYPLYFYRGRDIVHCSVVSWLQDSFGCFISFRGLKTTALMWAAGLWYREKCAGGTKGAGKELCRLDYVLRGVTAAGWEQHRRYPAQLPRPDVSTVSVELQADDMRTIAKCIMSDDAAMVSSGERDLLYSVLAQMMQDLTCLPRQAFSLHTVCTKCITLSRKGKVRITCGRHLTGLLHWLLQMHREDSLIETDLNMMDGTPENVSGDDDDEGEETE